MTPILRVRGLNKRYGPGCPDCREPGRRTIDAGGQLLLPGFIDIHSDVIETAIQPRPGGRFPVEVALHELDKQ